MSARAWIRLRRVAPIVATSLALAGCVALLDLQEIVPVDENGKPLPGVDGAARHDGDALDDGATASDGSCADLANDPKNCGSCGRVCQGACEAGTCVPRLLTKAGQTITGLALSPTDVYWVMSDPSSDASVVIGSMVRCAKAGCDQGTATVAPVLANPRALGIEGNLAAWMNSSIGNDFPIACSLATCATSLQFFSSTGAVDVATGGGVVVFTDPPTGAVRQGTLADASASGPLTASASPSLVAVTAGAARVVFAETSPARLRSCLRTSCSPITLATATGVKALTIAGNDAVFVDDAGLRIVPVDGSASARLLRATPPDAIAAEPGFVYLASTTAGTVSRCAMTDCANPTLVAGGLPGVAFLAVDASAVYAASGTAIHVLTKP